MLYVSGASMSISVSTFLVLLKKLVPLLEEVIIKDRSVREFLTDNRLPLMMLGIIIVLSTSLVNTRHKLYVARTDNPSQIVNSYKVPLAPFEPKGTEPLPPTPTPRKPTEEKGSVVTGREDDDLRKLIRERLSEN